MSAGAGAIALGFPVIVDQDIGDLQVPGALEYVGDHSETVKHSLALRNIKIKVKELPIPVAFAAAFEGEIIRKNGHAGGVLVQQECDLRAGDHAGDGSGGGPQDHHRGPRH